MVTLASGLFPSGTAERPPPGSYVDVLCDDHRTTGNFPVDRHWTHGNRRHCRQGVGRGLRLTFRRPYSPEVTQRCVHDNPSSPLNLLRSPPSRSRHHPPEWAVQTVSGGSFSPTFLCPKTDGVLFVGRHSFCPNTENRQLRDCGRRFRTPESQGF